MSPISKAARAYTLERNNFNYIRATIQMLLRDQNVSSDKLDKARGELEAAEEAFCATFDGLSKSQLRKTQDGRAYLYPRF